MGLDLDRVLPEPAPEPARKATIFEGNIRDRVRGYMLRGSGLMPDEVDAALNGKPMPKAVVIAPTKQKTVKTPSTVGRRFKTHVVRNAGDRPRLG
jgi:hypothetical protein